MFIDNDLFQWIVTIVGGGYVIVSLVLSLARKNITIEHEALKEKFEDFLKNDYRTMVQNVGRHFSEINDLHVDMARLRTDMDNHDDRFDGLDKKIDKLHDFMERIENKIDAIRDRRAR